MNKYIAFVLNDEQALKILNSSCDVIEIVNIQTKNKTILENSIIEAAKLCKLHDAKILLPDLLTVDKVIHEIYPMMKQLEFTIEILGFKKFIDDYLSLRYIASKEKLKKPKARKRGAPTIQLTDEVKTKIVQARKIKSQTLREKILLIAKNHNEEINGKLSKLVKVLRDLEFTNKNGNYYSIETLMMIGINNKKITFG